MATHDIITIGASAGGVEALRALVSLLPAELPAALFVVLHIPQDAPSLLPALLQRAGSLSARHPADNTPIETGRIYVAPPNRHMLLEPGRVRFVHGPKEEPPPARRRSSLPLRHVGVSLASRRGRAQRQSR